MSVTDIRDETLRIAWTAPRGIAMEQGDVRDPTAKEMRLRYAGQCSVCGSRLPAGSLALYKRATKSVQCVICPAETSSGDGQYDSPADRCEQPAELDEVQPAPLDPVDAGRPGASARREHERRRAKRDAEVRSKHPRIGGLILALQSDPQSTTAWATGAEGEEQFGARLNAIVSESVRVLHDRRIPRTRANIDHIVVCPTGVIVIDAKKYRGRPHLRIEGGILRPRTETLLVGTRNCTKLLDGVLRQVELVEAALSSGGTWDDVAVRGMLCFVEADWPLIGGSFTTLGIEVLGQKKAIGQIEMPGPMNQAVISDVHRFLAAAFPPA